ncbi:MAG: CopG family transcriptional regulator [Sporichthyaceae bacterium]
MRKTSVYLDEAESARLAGLAEAAGTSQAEIIRQAIRAYEPAPPDPAKRVFLLSGAGRPGDGTSIADLDMDELMRGFGE